MLSKLRGLPSGPAIGSSEMVQGLYRELYSRDGYPERANGQGDTRGEGEPPPRGPLAAERGEA